MANSDLKLNLILKAYDSMSGVVKSACRQTDAEFDRVNKTLEATAGKFDKAGKNAAVFGTALLAASGINAKLAGDFQEGMNNVSTLIDTNVESLDAMSSEILKIGKNSPKTIRDLTDGLYSIRSAGISASEQFNVLRGSEKLAVAGLATTAEAVDIATSAINAFSLKGEQSTRIYDMFFKVVKYGKTTVSEFAQGFGSVAGVVSAADIKLDEYSAAVAAMTTTGVKASIAHTQMKAVIAGLSRSTDDQVEIFNKLGAKSFKQLIAQSGSMVKALDKIKKAVGGDEAKIISLVGSVEAYNAVMSLTGATNKVYLQTLEDMRNGSDALSEAYIKQAAGFNNQLKIIGNKLQIIGIKWGNALFPVLLAAGGILSNVIDIIDKMPDGLTSFLSIATAGVGAISLFGGTTLMVVANIIKSFAILRTALRTTSILAWANPALLPIVGITAGIIALGAGAVYCYKKFEGFRTVCQGTWAVIRAGGAWLAVLWQSFLTGASTVWNFISPAVKIGATILSWTTPIGLVIRAITGLCGWIGKLIEKAGGLNNIFSKVKKWADDKTTEAQALNSQIKNNRKESRNIDGSHANGLDYVPFDGYRAELHKGESVLTRQEADIWRNNSKELNGIRVPYRASIPADSRVTTSSINNSGITFKLDYSPKINLSASTNSADLRTEFMNLLKTHAEEIARMIISILDRQTARAY